MSLDVFKTQEALARILGIDLGGPNYVTGFTVHCFAHRIPEVRITRYVNLPGDTIERRRFELHALDEPAPLDLDAMQAEAKHRVQRALERSCNKAHQQTAAAFENARAEAARRTIIEAADPLFRALFRNRLREGFRLTPPEFMQ